MSQHDSSSISPVVYRGIDQFAGYEFGADGSVWSVKSGDRVRLATRDRDGYPGVRLSVGGRRRDFQLSHLILMAFVGPRPSGAYALHRDDNRHNNAVDNLYWGTPRQNVQDAIRNDRFGPGRRTWTDQENEIALAYAEGFGLKRLARLVAVDVGVIRRIVRRHPLCLSAKQ